MSIRKFRTYMDVKPNKKRASVAYFCMEFGLNQALKDLFWWSWYLGRRLH